MRYKVTCAYNGLNYVGFQKQKNGLAVQEVFEDKLKVIFGQEIKIYMASRTDSGVHAYEQVFHFDSDKEINVFRLKGSLNGLLPKDIHVSNVEMVDEEFHSRFSVKSKTYEYHINIGEYNVFYKGLAYYCPFTLDYSLIDEALGLFIGEHDFGSFNTSPYDLYPDQKRKIYRFDYEIKDDLLIFTIEGNGFLRHMVRMIIGTIIDLARHKKTIDDIKNMIANPNKSNRRFNIDPNGLYLKKIRY